MTADELLKAYKSGERNFRGADLGGAGLGGADLGGADLGGADLGGADLGGAYLGDQWIIQGPVRTDGHFFFLMRLTGDQTPMVRAGCHWLSLPDARTHWSKTRGGTPVGDETALILDYLENVMKLRGLS